MSVQSKYEFTQEEVDRIATRLKADFSGIWRLLVGQHVVAEVSGWDDNKVDDPVQFVADRYPGNLNNLLSTIRSLANPDTMTRKDSLVWLAVEICRAVPRIRTNYDTFTEEDKQLAIRSVREQLPEHWARMVRIRGGRPLSNDQDLYNVSAIKIHELIDDLPVNWMEESRSDARKKTTQEAILFRHVLDAAKKESQN